MSFQILKQLTDLQEPGMENGRYVTGIIPNTSLLLSYG